MKTGLGAEGTGHREGQRLLIRGGTVVTERGAERLDVQVVDERITELGTLAPQPGEVVIDATGLHVLPGMIDVHVHVDDRIGEWELADTWQTVSQVGLRNGVTTLAGFSTQQPGETLGRAVERCVARASGRSLCDYAFHITPTQWPWDWREAESLVRRGFSTFKLYTTYREAGLFTDYGRLGEVMERLARLGARLLVHCEDDAALAGVNGSALDPADPSGHARLRPERAEVAAIERVLGLAEATNCPTHIVHVSTAEGATRIVKARARGGVSCETAPHYLLLDDTALAAPAGSRYLCTPPLRDPATRGRIESAAATGAFDLFATDHCAFTRDDKDARRGDFRSVPKGLAGVGALVPLMFELLVRRHRLPMTELATRLAANPARLLGVYPRKGTIAAGSDADLVLLDPEGPERPVRSSLSDCYETYPGTSTTLNVRHVLLRGREVVRDNVLLTQDRPGGRCLAG